MGTITIRTTAISDTWRRICITQAPGGKDGNLPVNRNATIAWKASEDGESFRVFFFDLDSPDIPIWPFREGSGGHPQDGLDDQQRPYLLVNNQAKPRKLKSDAPIAIKYDVVAVNPANADTLDPVIIIRHNSLAREGVLLGVTCAVLGAAAGALLVALWT